MKIKIDSRPIYDQCTDRQYKILIDASAGWYRKGSICCSITDGRWSLCWDRLPKAGSLFLMTYWDERSVQSLIKRGWLVPILSSKEVKVQHALGLMYDVPFKINPTLRRRVIKERSQIRY